MAKPILLIGVSTREEVDFMSKNKDIFNFISKDYCILIYFNNDVKMTFNILSENKCIRKVTINKEETMKVLNKVLNKILLSVGVLVFLAAVFALSFIIFN